MNVNELSLTILLFSLQISPLRFLIIQFEGTLFEHILIKMSKQIQTMDDLLFMTGLSLTSSREEPDLRPLYYNPLVVFAYSQLTLVQKLFALVTDDEFTLLVLCGDVSHYYGAMKYMMNSYFSLIACLNTGTQLIYYYNHWRGVRPTYLRVFTRLARIGDQTNSLGLTRDQVECLRRKSHQFLELKRLQATYLFLPILLIYNMASLYASDHSLLEIFVYGIPLALEFYYFSIIWLNHVSTHFIYFIILCKYFLMKLENVKQRMGRSVRSMRLNQTLRSFDGLYRQIGEYNDTYWSKFLFVFWLTLGTAGVNLLTSLVLFDLHRMVFFMLVYAFFFIIFQFSVIVLTAASVNYKANKCYCAFNSLFVSQNINRKTKISRTTRMNPKLKVFHTIGTTIERQFFN